MRSLVVFCVISSLVLAYVSALATPFTGKILERREDNVNNDMLDDLPLEKSLAEPTDPAELEKPAEPEKPKDVKISVHKAEGLRGMRCGPALYTESNLIEAASQACKLMKDKKKTWGFIRYPLSYQPTLEEIKSPLSTVEDDKPQGPYFLYPILQSGKVYKFGRTGPHRVILNRECQVAGAVIKLNSRTKCQGGRCWNPFRFQHLIYKTCDLDYYK